MTTAAIEFQVLTVLAVVALGAVLSVFALLVLRGRFGTPRRRVVFDLTEHVATHAPKDASMLRSARCMGHSADSAPVRGAGVLWLTADQLGFSLRQPRRDFTIDLGSVVSVATQQVVRRPGVRPIRGSSGKPFLAVEWTTPDGKVAMVSWRFDPELGDVDEAGWVEAIEHARVVHEIRAANV